MFINSQFHFGFELPPATQDLVKQQPMLFRATEHFALQHGGPLATLFLAALHDRWPVDEILIDSRVHMLMPGMWPCIPGWHHDDVPREREDGQPEYENPSYKSEHCMALFGDCSRTEFAVGRGDFTIPPVGEKIYKELDAQVEAACERGDLTRIKIPERRLVFFDCLTWHRGMPTTHRGFRYFIRATRGSKLEARNEIRHNANVYMPVMEEGW